MTLPSKSEVLSLVEHIDKESRDASEAGARAVDAGVQVGGGASGACVMDYMALYSHRRLHSPLGYLSPMQFEQWWYEAQQKRAAYPLG